jgi:hypothetical protein
MTPKYSVRSHNNGWIYTQYILQMNMDKLFLTPELAIIVQPKGDNLGLVMMIFDADVNICK